MRRLGFAATVLLGGLALAGCDSDFSGDAVMIPQAPAPQPQPPAPTEFNTISGIASKGIISGATVTVIDADGNELDVPATTGDDGSYSVDPPPELIEAGVSTPLQVVISSDGTATMVCDADLDASGDDDCLTGSDASGGPVYAAFGDSFTLPDDFMMRAVVATLPTPTDDGATVTVNPTPLTEIATALALGTGVTLTEGQVEEATAQVVALVSAITGVDLGDTPLNEIPVVNLVDPDAAAAASEAALAAASFSASVFSQVTMDDAASDTIAEALTGVSQAIVARVQATGNPSAFPPELLAAMTQASVTVIDAVAARLADAGLDNAIYAAISSAVSELAGILALVPDDIDVVIAPGGTPMIDLGDFEIPDPGGNDGGDTGGGTDGGDTGGGTDGGDTGGGTDGGDTGGGTDGGDTGGGTDGGDTGGGTDGGDTGGGTDGGDTGGGTDGGDTGGGTDGGDTGDGTDGGDTGDGTDGGDTGDGTDGGDTGDGTDGGDTGGGSATPPGTTEAASVNASLVGDYTLEYGDFSDDNDNDPFADGQSVSASVSADGTFTIDGTVLTAPYNRVSGGTVLTTEIYWFDAALQVEYALSNNDSGSFNEINVGDQSVPQASGFPRFLGQLTGTLDNGDAGGGSSATAACGDNLGGTVSGVQLLINCAGTYNVTDASAGFHPTGVVIIDETGGVDFDGENVFTADQVMAVFDRLFIEDEPRIQVNYGADDDGPAIQLFFAPGTMTVERISYRNRSENEENIATVVKAQ